MTRGLEPIVKYLNANNNLENIIEWNLSLSLIYTTTTYDFREILRENDNCINSPDFVSRVVQITQNMHKSFKEKSFNAEYAENITIAGFQKIFKTIPHNDIYSMFSLLRLILLHENYNIGYLRIDKYLKDAEIKRILGEELFNTLISYYYALSQISSCLANYLTQTGENIL